MYGYLSLTRLRVTLPVRFFLDRRPVLADYQLPSSSSPGPPPFGPTAETVPFTDFGR